MFLYQTHHLSNAVNFEGRDHSPGCSADSGEAMYEIRIGEKEISPTMCFAEMDHFGSSSMIVLVCM